MSESRKMWFSVVLTTMMISFCLSGLCAEKGTLNAAVAPGNGPGDNGEELAKIMDILYSRAKKISSYKADYVIKSVVSENAMGAGPGGMGGGNMGPGGMGGGNMGPGGMGGGNMGPGGQGGGNMGPG
ncbi:MAG: hypothetical protein ABH885_08265, partial [Candidatus Omnitrophota bacterium]